MSLEKTAYIASKISKNNLSETNATFAKMVQLLSLMVKNHEDTSTVVALNALTNPMPNLIVKITGASGTLTKGTLAVVAGDYVSFNGLTWVATEWISPVSSALDVYVNSVAGIEAYVAVQTAGQTIHVLGGDYVLTESLPILLAASGGGLKAEGQVTITGAAAADEAILIDPAVAAATFEYTIEGFNSIKGGADKIALNVANTATAKKVNVYLKRTSLNDNGTGVALQAINTDGSNAIRIYADGPGEIDSIAWTPKDGGDRIVISNYNIEENLVAAVVDVAATLFFKNCKIPHEGITGGHATNVLGFVGCWTEEVEYVPVAVDASDQPDGFSGTIL